MKFAIGKVNNTPTAGRMTHDEKMRAWNLLGVRGLAAKGKADRLCRFENTNEKMKTRFNLKWMLLAVLLLTGVRQARAFYDPGAQRWLNRDPLGENGFQLLRFRHSLLSQIVEVIEGPNLFEFVSNGPVNSQDALGNGNGCPGCGKNAPVSKLKR